MQFIIVTGMSGAGKSIALKFLEDIDFFCADNLPIELIPKFAEICFRSGSEIENVALGIDIRGGKYFQKLFQELEHIKELGYDYKILFLDSNDETLLKRYKETRRNHPLVKADRLIQGIQQERETLGDLKEKSTYILDTSFLLTRQLKEKINEIFVENKSFNNLMINVLSFGFKYGIPSDSDLVFDVRFIPNPFYIPEMRNLTGEDAEVKEYVMKCESSILFLDKLKDMIEFLIPNYINEGKNQLVISIGCTGGKHRSVTLAKELYDSLKIQGNSVVIEHRDILKDAKKFR